MPLYEYQCDSCHERFERIQKYSDPPVDVCPKCGAGPVKKLFSSPAIQFKGSGWYKTDSRPGEKSSDSNSSGSDKKSDTKSDTKTETKTETKSEKKSETKAPQKAAPKSDAAS